MPSSALAQAIPYDFSQTMSARHLPNRKSIVGVWPVSGTCEEQFSSFGPPLRHAALSVVVIQSRKRPAHQTAFVETQSNNPCVSTLDFCIACARVELKCRPRSPNLMTFAAPRLCI